MAIKIEVNMGIQRKRKYHFSFPADLRTLKEETTKAKIRKVQPYR